MSQSFVSLPPNFILALLFQNGVDACRQFAGDGDDGNAISDVTRMGLIHAIEEFLDESMGIKVDFEIGDAVDKLVRFELVQHCDNGLLRAVSLREALMAVDRAWNHAGHEFNVGRVTEPVPVRRSA